MLMAQASYRPTTQVPRLTLGMTGFARIITD
jgi:hypothetical protein